MELTLTCTLMQASNDWSGWRAREYVEGVSWSCRRRHLSLVRSISKHRCPITTSP